jgi:ribonucleoside-diphosphate reductase alpha chain
MSNYPTADIDRMAKGNRKIGLGVMGFADMLARLRVEYASPESFAVAEEVMGFVRKAARDESARLAEARGPFPNFKGSVFDRQGSGPVRNATVTTIAPTGTLSIIAGCSSGIEPFFALAFTRHVLEGETIEELNPLVEEIAREEGFYSEDLMGFVKGGGDMGGRDDVPERFRDLFRTAFDISPADHVRMQAAFQRHTDNAVSKTINLGPGATADDVREAYLLAYRLGCKGVTVYKTGTRAGQVLSCRDALYC